MKIPEIITKNAPAILSGLAVVGVAVTAFLTAKETPKAIKLMKEAEAEKHDTLTKFERVQVSAPAYVPAIAVGTATAVCIIFSNRISMKQIAALTATCIAMKKEFGEQFKKYRDKVSDIFGDDANLKVMESISHDKHPIPDVPKSEERLFCFNDGVEDRYFYSTLEKVLEAEYEVNRLLNTEGVVSLSEFYEMLNVSDDNGSEHLGWSWDMMADWYELCWIDFVNRVREQTDNDDPDKPECIDILCYTEPAAGYDDETWDDYLKNRIGG